MVTLRDGAPLAPPAPHGRGDDAIGPVQRLAAAFAAAHAATPPARRSELKQLLARLLGGLTAGAAAGDAAALDAVTELSLAVRRTDALVRDRPDWLGAETLAALQTEAAGLAATATRSREAWYVDVGPVVHAVLARAALRAWAAQRLGVPVTAITAPVAAGYLFYREAGDRCGLHVDNPRTHSVNCLVCLAHEPATDGSRSVLRVYLGGGRREALALRPGEAVLFEADAYPHERTPIGAGEQVTLLSFGMRWTEAP
jgi:hypothetical protein